MAGTRSTYDWEKISRMYRTGQLSVAELARQEGCSRTAIQKQMKKNPDEWRRDLSEDVNRRAKAKLQQVDAKSVAASPEQEQRTGAELDNAEVELAAEVRVQVVLSHRKFLADLKGACQDMLTELKTTIHNREEIEAEVYAETADDKSARRRNRMLAAVSLQSSAGVMRDLSASFERVSKLERQAFNLDDERNTESDPLEEVIREIQGGRVDLVAVAQESRSEQPPAKD